MKKKEQSRFLNEKRASRRGKKPRRREVRAVVGNQSGKVIVVFK